MSNPQLLQQFNSLLETSKAFQWLDDVQQAQIKARFANVSEEQLQLGITALQKAEAANAVDYLKIEKNEQLQKDLAERIKLSIQDLSKDQLKDQEKASQTADKSSLGSLDQQLNEVSQPDQPPRKKFLGLF